MFSPRNESARLRNLQKFYPTHRRDSGSSASSNRTGVSSNTATHPDSALTAFLQLVALRLSKQRALISLVDEDSQFFIAEGTKTGDLIDPTIFEESEDVQWMGCTGSTTRAEALCNYTIQADDVADSYPSFVVTDLRADPRFCELPYVISAPHFRYYAGVPLVSAAGFRVGSIFVIDTRVANAPTQEEVAFLGAMAANVMRYLEFQAEARLHARSTQMSRALSALVAPSGDQWSLVRGSEYSVTADAILAEDSEISAAAGRLFARAANLLREALDVHRVELINLKHDDRTSLGLPKPAKLRALSTKPLSSSSFAPDHELVSNKSLIEALCQHYPEGKLWCFKSDGSVRYEDDIANLPSGAPPPGNIDIPGQLHTVFPQAQQILIIPFHTDGSLRANTLCLAVKEDTNPLLSHETEVSFMRSFLNSLTVLHDRLTIKESESQKTQFISSISHELRSPLHGIVATTEMLAETGMTQQQQGMCNTLEVCTQTLIDTISQILDFNKINDFLRRTDLPSNYATHRGSSLHAAAVCDVGRLCEEVMTVTSLSRAKVADMLEKDAFTSSDAVQASIDARNDINVDLRIANHDWSFLCSPGALRRVMMNLVDNSFKYTKSGTIRVSLDLIAEGSTEQMLLLRVTDTGIGMSTEFLRKHLFVPFSQAASVAPGSGLGLSLVHGIIESLGGKVDVQSKLGQGTEVLIKIPLQRPEGWVMSEKKVMYPDWTFSIGPARAVGGSVRHYMKEWFGFREVLPGEPSDIAIISADEQDSKDGSRTSALLILHPVASPTAELEISNTIPVEAVTMPIGPIKLMKAVQSLVERCKDRSSSPSSRSNGRISNSTVPLRTIPTENSSSLPRSDLGGRTDAATTSEHRHAKTAHPRILCVDDNAINLKLLIMYSKRVGFDFVTGAEDGLQAFEAYEMHDEGYDLIFMDLTMPICDGFRSTTMIRQLEKKRQRRSTIFAFTGLASAADQEKAFAAGIDHFVTKPLRFKDFKALLQACGVLNMEDAVK